MKKVLIIGLIVFLLGSAFGPLFSVVLTPEWLTLAAGAVLSLAFSFVPGLNVWYAAKSETFKKWFMVGMLCAVSGVLITSMCLSVIVIEGLTCSEIGIGTFLETLLLAILANQGVYGLTPLPQSVRIAKLRSKTVDETALKKAKG